MLHILVHQAGARDRIWAEVSLTLYLGTKVNGDAGPTMGVTPEIG